MKGIITPLTGQVKRLAENQGVSSGRLDVESHLDQELDYHENRANLLRQFGLNGPSRTTPISVSRQEAEELYREYEAELAANELLHSVKARRTTENPTFKHLSKQLWQITAKHLSICGTCKGVIHDGEKITMLESEPRWSHVAHAQLQVTA